MDDTTSIDAKRHLERHRCGILEPALRRVPGGGIDGYDGLAASLS